MSARHYTRSLGFTGRQNKIPASGMVRPTVTTTARLKLLLLGCLSGKFLSALTGGSWPLEAECWGQSRSGVLIHELCSPSVPRWAGLAHSQPSAGLWSLFLRRQVGTNRIPLSPEPPRGMAVTTPTHTCSYFTNTLRQGILEDPSDP